MLGSILVLMEPLDFLNILEAKDGKTIKDRDHITNPLKFYQGGVIRNFPMAKLFKSSILGLFITTILAGFIWGVMRIELILLVPFFYMVDFIFDILVYSYAGYLFGRITGRYYYKQAWLVIFLPLLFYASDRFLSPRLILGNVYSGRTDTIWRIIIEFLIIFLAIVFAWRGHSSHRESRKPMIMDDLENDFC